MLLDTVGIQTIRKFKVVDSIPLVLAHDSGVPFDLLLIAAHDSGVCLVASVKLDYSRLISIIQRVAGFHLDGNLLIIEKVANEVIIRL